VARIEDKDFLAELERITLDFSAALYNNESESIEPAFIELITPVFNRERELVINNQRGVLIRELLRPLRESYDKMPRKFLTWGKLQESRDAEQLRAVIIEWGQYWNLNADWCRDYAVAALCDWLTDRIVLGQWNGEGLSFRGATFAIHSEDIWTAPFDVGSPADKLDAKLLSNLTQGFSFTWKGLDFQTHRWNPLSSYRDKWERDCEEGFNAYLSQREKDRGPAPAGVMRRFRAARAAYIRKMEKVAEEVGLIRTPRRWADEHLTWAVEFQDRKSTRLNSSHIL